MLQGNLLAEQKADIQKAISLFVPVPVDKIMYARMAFIVGNTNYRGTLTRVNSAKSDADGMADLLTNSSGFEPIAAKSDLGYTEFVNSFAEYVNILAQRKIQVVFFWYAF